MYLSWMHEMTYANETRRTAIERLQNASKVGTTSVHASEEENGDCDYATAR